MKMVRMSLMGLGFLHAFAASFVSASPVPTKIEELTSAKKIILVFEKANVFLKPASSEAGLTWTGASVSPDRESSLDSATLRWKEVTENLTVHVPKGFNVSVHLSEGQIQLDAVEGNIFARLHRGNLKASQTKGKLDLHVVRGQIRVINHQGDLGIDSAWADVNVQQGQGNLKVAGFQNTLDVQKYSGVLGATYAQGSMRLVDIDGQGTVDAQKAGVNFSGLKGRFEVVTSEGAINGQVNAVSDLVLKSQSGKVSTKVVPPASPIVWAWSGAGELQAPLSMKSQRDAFGKSAKGRWPASELRGSLSIRTQEGSILVQ